MPVRGQRGRHRRASGTRQHDMASSGETSTTRCRARSPAAVICRDQIAQTPVTDGDAAAHRGTTTARPTSRVTSAAPEPSTPKPSEVHVNSRGATVTPGPPSTTCQPGAPGRSTAGQRPEQQDEHRDRDDERAGAGSIAAAHRRGGAVSSGRAPRQLARGRLRAVAAVASRCSSARRAAARPAPAARACRTPAGRAPGAARAGPRRVRVAGAGAPVATARRRRPPGGAARRRSTRRSTTSPGRTSPRSTGVKCTSRPSRARPLIRWVAPSLRPSPVATSTSTIAARPRRLPPRRSPPAARRGARTAPARRPWAAGRAASAAGVPGAASTGR